MRDAYCSYKLSELLQNAGFDFSGSGKLVNSRGEILPSEILGFAQACDGTEEPTSTLQSVRSWLVDRGFGSKFITRSIKILTLQPLFDGKIVERLLEKLMIKNLKIMTIV